MSNNMQNLKIYDIIDQLEDLIENSPKPKLSGSATKRTSVPLFIWKRN